MIAEHFKLLTYCCDKPNMKWITMIFFFSCSDLFSFLTINCRSRLNYVQQFFLLL
uniref:Uncharacterized protein n=1 Tax=Arundo donax TaxID=35708 RepID=A0A0A9BEX9_ARUDO